MRIHMRNKKIIDLSVRRRMYYGVGHRKMLCPECNAELIKESCPILLIVESTPKSVLS